MIESTTALTLNLQYPNVAVVAYAVQGDQAARKISAQLVDGGTAWTPPANALATIRYRKPDGTTGFYDADENDDPAIVVDGSTALITIANQALTVPGVVLMQLQFYTPENQRVTTFAWSLVVQPSVLTDKEFVSEDYYNILTAQIAAVLNAAASLTGMTARATPLASMADPTVNVTGGTSGDPYDLLFGIPAGPYYTPAVDAAGNISWSNNGDLDNPAAQNIKGPQGVSITSIRKKSGTGAPGTTDIYGVNLSNGQEAGTFDVYNGRDGQGSPGSQVPLADAAAGFVGTAIAYAREDHRHPSPLLIVSAPFAIPAPGSSVSYDMPGMTEDHQLTQWNFSATAENDSPAALDWVTYDGYFTITNNGGVTSETMQPVFELPVSVAITAHS